MIRILTITFGLLLSMSTYGQDSEPGNSISTQDSILLSKFWVDFTNAIENSDKNKIATLCEFPFYCQPCIDDTMLKHNNHITVKVTKKLFYDRQYKEFFGMPIKSMVAQNKNLNPLIFSPTFDYNNKRNGFSFSYTIVAPSKTREGSQGFIYLTKKKGKYKITGIDIIP